MELKATVLDTAGFGFYLWQPYYGNINSVRELGPDRGYLRGAVQSVFCRFGTVNSTAGIT